ncbi:MAG: hypothetical protein SFY68_12840 [Candidatus Sumerlaeia bacterium]|nr:hypothetical protein [Candidatus Sumerlaeia bacterium]
MVLHPPQRQALIVLWFLLVATLQIFVFPQWSPTEANPTGEWFLFGTDTVSHDAPLLVTLWEATRDDFALPLWIPELQGGLPTVGAFVWAPGTPVSWLFYWLNFPLAQKLQYVVCLAIAGLGGYLLGRVQNTHRFAALFLGTSLSLSGHVVTLIHAGHLQKIQALVWLPWFLVGLVMLFHHQSARSQQRGMVYAALALGMAFLSGHPQVAYMMLMALGLISLLCVRRVLASGTRHVVFLAVLLLGTLMLGFSLGAFQLLPGLEMSALSNRSGGVNFAEATATSYPARELWEFFLPRFTGDSSAVGYGRYVGGWGERLVSDYMGAMLFFPLILGFFLALRNALGRFWLALGVLSILIGLGNSFPLYGVLHAWLPGFSSFRSPGTFLALAAIALPMVAASGIHLILTRFEARIPTYLRIFGILFSVAMFVYMLGYTWEVEAVRAVKKEATDAAMGTLFYCQALNRSALFVLGFSCIPLIAYAIGGKFGGTRWWMGTLFSLLLAFDLLSANSAFLRREPYTRFQQYLMPGLEEQLLLTMAPPLRSAFLDAPLSLRPVAQGRDALEGYHPISFARFIQQLEATPLSTLEGMQRFGVNTTFTLESEPPVEGADVRGFIRGKTLWQLPRSFDPVQFRAANSTELVPLNWIYLQRTPQALLLDVEPVGEGHLILRENNAPGWHYRSAPVLEELASQPWQPVATLPGGFERLLEKPAGHRFVELTYEPRSVFFGALLSAVAAGLLLMLFVATAPARVPHLHQTTPSLPEKDPSGHDGT